MEHKKIFSKKNFSFPTFLNLHHHSVSCCSLSNNFLSRFSFVFPTFFSKIVGFSSKRTRSFTNFSSSSFSPPSFAVFLCKKQKGIFSEVLLFLRTHPTFPHLSPPEKKRKKDRVLIDDVRRQHLGQLVVLEKEKRIILFICGNSERVCFIFFLPAGTPGGTPLPSGFRRRSRPCG